MSRYVDADKTFHIELFDDGIDDHIKQKMTVAEILDEFTDEGCGSTDVVEVIRCKGCKDWRRNKKNDGHGKCEYWTKFINHVSPDTDIETYKNCFCCWGEAVK